MATLTLQDLYRLPAFRQTMLRAAEEFQMPQLRELVLAAGDTTSLPRVHPFAPFPDDPYEGWTAEQIRLLSGQLIKR
jgi:hypothetical protein